MTTLQKTIIGAAVIAAVGTGIVQTHRNANLRDEVESLQQDRAPLAAQIQQLKGERDEAMSRLAALQDQMPPGRADNAELLKLRAEVSRLRSAQQRPSPGTAGLDPNDPGVRQFLAARAAAEQISRYLEQMPEKNIPEVKLLTDEDWLALTRNAKFDTDANVRKTLSQVRSQAKQRTFMGGALSSYTRANNGQLPTDVSQLKPFFKSALENHGGTADDATLDSIFERYALLHSGNVRDYPTDTWFVAEKAPVDKDYDSRAKFGVGRSTVIATGIGEAGDPDDKSY